MTGPRDARPAATGAPGEAGEGPEEGWGEPRPAHVPRPTAWPMLFAAAVVMLFFSLSSSPVVGVVGGLAFAVTLAGWIGELLHERRVERDLGG